MSTLKNKIDFALVFSVKTQTPMGPSDGNRPRMDYRGYGEVSDVCLKRKIRNRLLDMGEAIFVQSDDRRIDEYRSLKDRADGCPALAECMKRLNKSKRRAMIMRELPARLGMMFVLSDKHLLLKKSKRVKGAMQFNRHTRSRHDSDSFQL